MNQLKKNQIIYHQIDKIIYAFKENSSNSSNSSEKYNISTHNTNFFILSPKTPIQRKNLKIVYNFILTKRISLIKHISFPNTPEQNSP